MTKQKEPTISFPALFYPISHFSSSFNSLSAIIYTYMCQSEKKSGQVPSPFLIITKCLKITSQRYPSSFIGYYDRQDEIPIYYLTRFLSLIILLEFNQDAYNYLITIYESNMSDDLIKTNDPIHILNKLIESKKNEKDIDQLIKLLSIFIKFSDYDSNAVENLAHSISHNFLKYCNLQNFGKDQLIYFQKYQDESELQHCGIYTLYYNDDRHCNGLLFNIEKGSKLILCKHDLQSNSDNLVEYTVLDNFQLSNFKKKFELSIGFPEDYKADPSFNKQSVDIDKSDETNNGNSPINLHYNYFIENIDDIIKNIQEIDEQEVKLSTQNGIIELFSIVRKITILNYFLVMKCESDDENIKGLVVDLLLWENYLLLLIENTDQIGTPDIIADMSSYIIIMLEKHDNWYIKDKNENKELKDLKEIKEIKEIFSNLTKFTLYLILLNSKKICKKDEQYFSNNLICFIVSEIKENEKEWIDKYFTTKNYSRNGRNLNSFRYERSRFEISEQLGSFMNTFYFKSNLILKRHCLDFTDIINDVKKYGIMVREPK
ncbi:hypothetical protein M9Y10_004950 [Tritrichomonas musculus]|uniref:Uncharacterized protein n=1 Tax=Tritrichomonas musculus TaxID=1915356 RepID=A0ABR2JMC5_9EUKA